MDRTPCSAARSAAAAIAGGAPPGLSVVDTNTKSLSETAAATAGSAKALDLQAEWNT
jgi:hypothetical protein